MHDDETPIDTSPEPVDAIDEPTDDAPKKKKTAADDLVAVVVAANFNQYRRGDRLTLPSGQAQLWISKGLVEATA